MNWRERSSAERQQAVVTVLGAVALVGVQVATAAMSWAGLVTFGREVLGLGAAEAVLVPAALDGAGMAAAALALLAVLRGESAAGPRVLVVAFTCASAWANWVGAEAAHGRPAAVFFAGMSVSVVVLFDQVLRQMRRRALLAVGAVERPMPKFRALRWLRFPRETWQAWSVALRHGLESPSDALAALWGVEGQASVEVVDVESAAGELPAEGDADGVELESLSKAEAVRVALAATDGGVPAALAWLAERGVSVDRSYAYDVAGRPAPPRRALLSVASVAGR